jgi:hypothetical protein
MASTRRVRVLRGLQPKTLEEASLLASWAALNAARGKLTVEECHAIKKLLEEFRELKTAAHDTAQLDRLEAAKLAARGS